MEEIRSLCTEATAALLKDPSLIRLKGPLCIAGNVNGQYKDLVAALCAGGWPPGLNSNWLFLGDYISRGSRSMECLCLLLGLKLLFPANIFLLRGHHEDPDIAYQFGFKSEVDRRLGIANSWALFRPVFEALPFAALIGESDGRKILAVHGGISPKATLKDIADLPRPTTVPRAGLITDLLWADLDPLTRAYADSDRGVSHKFGPKAINAFLSRNGLSLIIRSHQLVQQGFQFSGPSMLTIWTAPGYGSEFSNAGAIAVLDARLQLSLRVLMMEADEEADMDDGNPRSARNAADKVPLVDLVQENLAAEEAAKGDKEGGASTKGGESQQAPGNNASHNRQSSRNLSNPPTRASPRASGRDTPARDSPRHSPPEPRPSPRDAKHKGLSQRRHSPHKTTSTGAVTQSPGSAVRSSHSNHSAAANNNNHSASIKEEKQRDGAAKAEEKGSK